MRGIHIFHAIYSTFIPVKWDNFSILIHIKGIWIHSSQSFAEEILQLKWNETTFS